jgi:hypothetical protein
MYGFYVVCLYSEYSVAQHSTLISSAVDNNDRNIERVVRHNTAMFQRTALQAGTGTPQV